jgi:poly-gamma-glutamate synthesis protein (capsule biosynthesis protein)
MKSCFYKGVFLFCVVTLLNCSDMKTKVEYNSKSQKDNYDFKDEDPGVITLFLSGDVMTGRGIDQILPNAGDPTLYESYMKNARGYVKLAENLNGPISKPVDFSYIWGDAIKELDSIKPDVRIINLETTITESNDYWQGKAVHYRMHPGNIKCLTAVKIDFCSLANNHILDWGYSGLAETIEILKKNKIKFAGAGFNLNEAETPGVIKIDGKGRVIIISLGSPTSGVPLEWAAGSNQSGINILRDFSEETILKIKNQVAAEKQKEDVVLVSIHWGSNWGYDVSPEHTEFARKLIDIADVDLIHGHSSHHPRPIEVYKDRLIIYGAGDLLNDYEGITGYEQFRDDLSLMYFASIDPSTGKLVKLQMVPMQIKKIKLSYATNNDVRWLQNVLNRECEKFNTKFDLSEDNTLLLKW